ncbi:hypothetical protein [Hymenobacter ruricola]|uniref:Uncharacterized protein n=1 Tax=Hymenobacter ruricola TaxID=2791023 RepID=A0ABS0HXQ2_9BACT|nr:hypothetical protein [Hymenobacter ruricola]MBF9219483.1 hypothetical protein [Hymenobacter ruricola]
MDNLNATAIPAAVLADALKKIRDARAALAPYLHPLTTEQRQELPKMGDKTLAFVTKMAGYAQNLPSLMPSYLDVTGLLIDAATSNDLLEVYQELDGFTLDVDSTRMIAGSEGYTASLIGYGALQGAAKTNQPGAQAAVAELAPRFARPTNAAKATKKAGNAPAA